MESKDIKRKIQSGERLRVLFLNDLGFQYGAGIALLRQIQSFLLMGHEVKALCWTQGEEGAIPFIPLNATGVWEGMRELQKIHRDHGYSEADIIHALMAEIKSLHPDFLIIGNLHGANWPLKLLLSLKEMDCLVIAYMHDLHLVTGRCAYPGNCRLYETGCDETCPTAGDYPFLSKNQIAGEWKLRREIFCGPDGIPLATNSRWVLDVAKRSLKGLRYADVVYCGLDDHLFKPIDRVLSKRLVGLSPERFVILMGAVNVSDTRKGGRFFDEIFSGLADDADFLIFGQDSSALKGVTATGLIRDYRKMPIVYSAADLFVGTSEEEAFGQTFFEAAACGVPVVGFSVGGVPEAARNNYNARLVDDISAAALIKEIRFFMDNPEAREAFGNNGRRLVESEFSLKKQGDRWMKYLCEFSKS